MNNRLNWLLLPFAFCVGTLFLVFNSAEATHASMTTATPFIALYGDANLIDSVVMPYEMNNELKVVREYPSPADYLFEGGIMPTMGNLALRMYQVTVPAMDVAQVITNVVTDASNFIDVETVYPDFTWLSYAPEQVVIHGVCTDVAKVEMNLDSVLDTPALDALLLDYPGTVGFPEQCVRLYKTKMTNPQTVEQIVTSNGATLPLARAEPNFYASGFMGAYAIYGSPAAMLPNAPVTSTSGTTPLTGVATGDEVGVYVFDTSPYVAGMAEFTRTIKGKAVQIRNVNNIAGALFPALLPFNAARDAAAHGTFVATPIVDHAPDSKLTIVRVLTNDAVGTQYAFAKGVDWAIKDAFTNGQDWHGVIFNYSLGLEDTTSDGPRTAMNRMLNMVNFLDITQVAAAGNDSAFESMPMPMNLPAANPHVMGVTALVPGNQLACYANSSRHPGPSVGFAARGGGIARGSAPVCDVDAHVQGCSIGAWGGCLHGWDPTSPTNFSWGIGTSFAAPHIVGYAAQVLENNAPPREANWTKPSTVRTVISDTVTAGDADLGVGYIGAYSTPTAVGLSSGGVTPLVLPLLFITVLAGFSGVVVWRRYHLANS